MADRAHLACATILLGLTLGLAPGPGRAQTSDLVSRSALRVCADPANVPVSDESGAGYENRIAELVAEELDLPLRYTWFPMGVGFLTRTLLANECDLVIGYGQGAERVQNTNHYYTSGYLLIVPADGPLADVSALSDPLLGDKRLGIVAATPPATHMLRHGLIPQARSYPVMVDRRVESPAQDMLADLEAGEIDAAVLWGPIGGPLVKADHPGLTSTLLLSEDGPPKMFYRITMAVRPGEKVWQHQLDALIRQNRDRIDAILTEAGVPLLDDMGNAALGPEQ